MYLWHGQLAFELYRASEPAKGLQAFYDIIKKIIDPNQFDQLCSPFDIETAQSSIAYRWVSERSTAGALISTSLRSSLWVSDINLGIPIIRRTC